VAEKSSELTSKQFHYGLKNKTSRSKKDLLRFFDLEVLFFSP
jgi:hypothetical protein